MTRELSRAAARRPRCGPSRNPDAKLPRRAAICAFDVPPPRIGITTRRHDRDDHQHDQQLEQRHARIATPDARDRGAVNSS